MPTYIVPLGMLLFLIHASGGQQQQQQQQPRTTSTPLYKYIDLMYQDDETFRAICFATTGSGDLAERMVQENRLLKQCVDRFHDPKRFLLDLDQMDRQNHASVINYHCSTFEKIRKCFDPFSHQMELCFNELDFQIASDLIILNKEFDYICENGGANVRPGSTNYTQCGAALNTLLEECAQDDWPGLASKTINTLTEPDCRSLESINTCFHRRVEDCGAPLFADLLELRFGWIIGRTSCKTLTSTASA